MWVIAWAHTNGLQKLHFGRVSQRIHIAVGRKRLYLRRVNASDETHLCVCACARSRIINSSQLRFKCKSWRFLRPFNFTCRARRGCGLFFFSSATFHNWCWPATSEKLGCTFPSQTMRLKSTKSKNICMNLQLKREIFLQIVLVYLTRYTHFKVDRGWILLCVLTIFHILHMRWNVFLCECSESTYKKNENFWKTVRKIETM